MQRVPDGGGGFVESWSPIVSLFADIKPAGGRERVEHDRLAGRVSHEIVLRYRDRRRARDALSHRDARLRDPRGARFRRTAPLAEMPLRGAGPVSVTVRGLERLQRRLNSLADPHPVAALLKGEAEAIAEAARAQLAEHGRSGPSRGERAGRRSQRSEPPRLCRRQRIGRGAGGRIRNHRTGGQRPFFPRYFSSVHAPLTRDLDSCSARH